MELRDRLCPRAGAAPRHGLTERSRRRALKVASAILRRLPAVPGKVRLGRWLLDPLMDTSDIHLGDRYGCTYVVPALREPIAFHLLLNGVYEVETVELVLSQLRSGSILVDVGANVGVFTMPAGRRVGVDGRVVAIEPSPTVFAYLAKNLALNGLSNVSLHCSAAFDREATAVPFYEAPAHHFGMGSLAAQFGSAPTVVPARRLDSVLGEEGIERVDVLKVDVEGFEAAVFRGAERLLTGPHPPPVIFEFCDWAEARVPGSKVGEAQRLLLSYGYRLHRLAGFRVRPPLPGPLLQGSDMLVAVPPEVGA